MQNQNNAASFKAYKICTPKCMINTFWFMNRFVTKFEKRICMVVSFVDFNYLVVNFLAQEMPQFENICVRLRGWPLF